MPDKMFIDTNILVYAFLENEQEKHEKAVGFLSNHVEDEVFVSTQVLSEVYAALSKNGIEHEAIERYLLELEERMNIEAIDFQTISSCLSLKKRYGYSWWDSLILAAALACNCSVVYSEDMQDGQVIEDTLTIVNPLKNG